MILRDSIIHATLTVNEYIERWVEIQPHLDQAIEWIPLEEIKIINDGCKPLLVTKITKYLSNHGIHVYQGVK